jgi:hypothetical protein
MSPMSESLAEKFEDLDYPGRRKPVNRGTKDTAPLDTPVWAVNPMRYKLPGSDEVREFYTISHLAKALDYSIQSIRAWEDRGLLPRSGIRSPRTRGKAQAAGSHKGKRLWTREQIEGILRLARRHKVIVNRRPPTAAFARDVSVLFQQLAAGSK